MRVATGARLHFGLLNVVPPFGGVGVMVSQPATEIMVGPDRSFGCDEDPDGRIRAIARRVALASGSAQLPRCRVSLVARPDAHSGLGSGTQLALAVAEAMCRFVDHRCGPVALARQIAERGERSAVGIHGYFSGGLIYESGQPGCQLNPIRQRVELPAEWCVALFRPAHSIDPVSGDREREQFSRLAHTDADLRSELEVIVKKQMLPAARSVDFDAFAAAVSSYNHHSGMMFASVQGGAYNGGAITDLVQSLIDRGARGVGQSSWGPSVFAWFREVGEARQFESTLPPGFPQPRFAHPLNRGRTFCEFSTPENGS